MKLDESTPAENDEYASMAEEQVEHNSWLIRMTAVCQQFQEDNVDALTNSNDDD